MELLPIRELRQRSTPGPLGAVAHVKVEAAQTKVSRNGKDFLEIRLADATDNFILRVFNDSPAWSLAQQLTQGDWISVEGEWTNGSFGLESRQWTARALTEEERAALLEGPAALREKQAADWADIVSLSDSVRDPRLRTLCRTFLAEHGERFRRTAAARQNHHARRGGLVEHVAQMMRSASALCTVYTTLNRDLLLTGVLFHDCGKLWENCYPADGFAAPVSVRAELLGHIPIGIELVNAMWRKIIETEDAAAWTYLQPSSNDVRTHLLHLIASHHGTLEFGSPVMPKTPEAQMLHYVDNIDAKMEMFFQSYGDSTPSGVYPWVKPLGVAPVSPLLCCDAETPEPVPEESP